MDMFDSNVKNFHALLKNYICVLMIFFDRNIYEKKKKFYVFDYNEDCDFKETDNSNSDKINISMKPSLKWRKFLKNV